MSYTSASYRRESYAVVEIDSGNIVDIGESQGFLDYDGMAEMLDLVCWRNNIPKEEHFVLWLRTGNA